MTTQPSTSSNQWRVTVVVLMLVVLDGIFVVLNVLLFIVVAIVVMLTVPLMLEMRLMLGEVEAITKLPPEPEADAALAAGEGRQSDARQR